MRRDLPEAIAVALRVVDVLEGLGVGYHVGGSYASSVHGVPRQTQDIDLVVDLPEGVVDAFVARLGDGFYVDAEAARGAVRGRDSFNVVHRETAIKIDVFLQGDAPFDREESGRTVTVTVDGDPPRVLRVKAAEDILLRKLLRYRDGGGVSERQWNDAIGVARVQASRLDRAYLERWAATLGVGDLLRRVLAD